MNIIRRVSPVLVLLLSFSLNAQTKPDTWTWLMNGNEDFRKGPDLEYKDITGVRRDTAGKQSPRATIVACSDSRVPPELIFHKTLGEVFVIRVAGNIVDDFALGSIEYAASGPPFNSWSDLVMVLGHSNCGAVTAALGNADFVGTNLQSILERIRESFSGMPSDVKEATEANALAVVAYIRAHSPRMRQAEERGDVKIRAAYYDLASGVVTEVLPPPPRP